MISFPRNNNLVFFSYWCCFVYQETCTQYIGLYKADMFVIVWCCSNLIAFFSNTEDMLKIKIETNFVIISENLEQNLNWVPSLYIDIAIQD